MDTWLPDQEDRAPIVQAAISDALVLYHQKPGVSTRWSKQRRSREMNWSLAKDRANCHQIMSLQDFVGLWLSNLVRPTSITSTSFFGDPHHGLVPIFAALLSGPTIAFFA